LYIWYKRKVKEFAKKYFEPIPPKSAPKVTYVEPIQTGERRITVKEVATPYLMIATTP
jgi:predicted Zn-dependent peptidase